jgi:hypothetical protein
MDKETIQKATHDGDLEIGDIKISCYVLEDGARVLSGNGMIQTAWYKRHDTGTRFNSRWTYYFIKNSLKKGNFTAWYT